MYYYSLNFTLRYHMLALETQSCVLRDGNYDKLGAKSQSLFYRFKNSKFYTSAIIVGNFMLFIAIPDMVFTLYLHLSPTHPPFICGALLTLMNLFSDLCDFVIYVFIQKQVRELFFQKLLTCFKRKPRKSLNLRRERAVKRKPRGSQGRTGTTLSHISSSEV